MCLIVEGFTHKVRVMVLILIEGGKGDFCHQ